MINKKKNLIICPICIKPPVVIGEVLPTGEFVIMRRQDVRIKIRGEFVVSCVQCGEDVYIRTLPKAQPRIYREQLKENLFGRPQ